MGGIRGGEREFLRLYSTEKVATEAQRTQREDKGREYWSGGLTACSGIAWGMWHIHLLESEKKAVLSGTMDDSAYLYGIVLDNVKDQIPVHNQHAVSKSLEPVIFWNNSKKWMCC